MDTLRKLIAKGEQRANINLRYMFRGGFWLGIGQVISASSAFLLALAFANVVPKEIYGTYKYALSIAALFAIFTLPGIATSFTRSSARNMEGSYVPVTKARMRWALIGCAVGFCVALYYALAGNTSLVYVVAIICIFLPFFDVFSTFSFYLQGKQDFRRSIILASVIQVVSTTCLLLAIFCTKNLYILLVVYFSSYALMRYLCYRYILSEIRKDAPQDPEAITYGKHLSLMSILSTVASNIDNIVLFHFLGPIDVAIYTIATAPPDQLKAVLAFLTTLLFPTVARENEEEVRKTILYRFLLFFIVSLVIIGIYILLAPLFFKYFFHAYASYAFMSQVFAVSLLTVTFDPALLFLSAHKKVKEQYWSTTIGNTLQIVAIVGLAIPYGIWGVIIARVSVRFVSNLINVYYFYFPFKTKAAPIASA